ncbi:MAG: hypothetical protein R2705_03340 [Ilumatobacteraceae bacterium]
MPATTRCVRNGSPRDCGCPRSSDPRHGDRAGHRAFAARSDRVHHPDHRRPRRARGGAPVVESRRDRRDRHRGSRPTLRLPTGSAKTVPNSIVHGHLSPVQQRRRRLRELLLGLGLTEVMPNPFLGEDDLARAGLPTEALRLANPLVAEAPILRTALRPGMLSTVAYNESHRSTGVAIFEIGHVYPPSGEQLPAEYEALAVAIAGAEAPAAVSVWREIAAELGFGCRLDQGIVPPGMHPGRSASLTQGRTVVGIVGEIHPAVLAEFDVAERVAYLELDLDIVLGAKESIPQAKPVSRFPSADVDLAFDVPDDVAAEKVDKALRQGAGKLLADVSLFDVYRKPGVEGTRSLAYRVRFQVPDCTSANRSWPTPARAASPRSRSSAPRCGPIDEPGVWRADATPLVLMSG